jgi:inner membrane transporter RhtA
MTVPLPTGSGRAGVGITPRPAPKLPELNGRSGALRERAVTGAAMIVGTSLSIQLAAAIAHDLFDRLGPVGASAARFALAAVILLAIARPAIRGRDAATWGAIAAYGGSLAALNLTFFQAISLIPMGIAVTLSFIGPLAMALVGSRRRSDVVWALLAGAGVATLGGIDRPGSVSGVLYAIAAGCAWVGVAYAARSVGRRTRRVDSLALAIPIAAVITVPLGIGHADAVDVPSLAIALVIAVGGLIIPFALEMEGLRRLEPRIVAVIYSIDPAIAAVVGFLALGEQLTGPQVVALVAVTIASAGATAAAAKSDDGTARASPAWDSGTPRDS